MNRRLSAIDAVLAAEDFVADAARQGASAALKRLTLLRARLTIRIESLPADLALAGLLDDLLAAAAAAVALPADGSTAVAYPLTRIAFEAAQRVIVLATDEDYLRVGTRAWLYYQRKDASVLQRTDPDAAARWLDQALTQLREIWTPYNHQADDILRAEAEALDKHREARRPDNFMGHDLAGVVDARYPLFLAPRADLSLAELTKINRGIYATLSRESHARMRADAAAFVISSRNGTIEVLPRSTDEVPRWRTLLGCLETSIGEAAGSLAYFLEKRERLRAERMRLKAQAASGGPSPPGFRPDLGLRLASMGGARTTLHLSRVPVYKLGVLPDGSASWSADILLGDGEYITTFDVPAALRNELARCMDIDADALAPVDHLVMHELAGPPRVGLECKLGDVQQGRYEPFVPLVVIRVTTGAPG